MRNSLILIAITSSALALSACANVQKTWHSLHSGSHENAPTKKTAYQPDWYKALQSNSQDWKKAFTQHSLNPKATHYFSQTNIQTRAFSNIVIDGNYQVQILGGQKQAGLEILSNWNQARRITVNVDNNTLHISGTDNTSKQVTVRIGATSINSITLNGSAVVVAKNLLGNSVSLINNGSGNLLTDGAATVSHVTLNGSGNIAVLGANGKNTTILNKGSGNIHMSGKYNVRTLTDSGSGNIKIVGLNSNDFNINSTGSGDIIASGFGNLTKLMHSGSGNVYFYWASSSRPQIIATGSGTIGIAGNADHGKANIGGSVYFDGRFLRIKDFSIKTTDSAHAKVIATQQLLATATDKSQIYYYNTPKHLLKHHSGSGAVLDLSHEDLPKWCAPVKKDDGYTG